MASETISGLGMVYTPPKSELKLGSDVVTRDDFLRLLVAQLQHQDPLNPMENQEFVAELATFSALEQQTNQTELLKQLIAAQQGDLNSQALSMIGRDVVAATDSFDYRTGEEPTFLFEAPEAGEVVVTITSEAGTIVRTDRVVVPSPGAHSYAFDGKSENGSELAPGRYTISIGSGMDAEGNRFEYPVYLTGQVTEVRFDNGKPVLTIDGQTVALSDVLAVRYRDERRGEG